MAVFRSIVVMYLISSLGWKIIPWISRCIIHLRIPSIITRQCDSKLEAKEAREKQEKGLEYEPSI